jgi:hypothetical protein
LQVTFNCPEILDTYCQNLGNSSAKLAFFIEDIQYSSFNALCRGAALTLKNFTHHTYVAGLFTSQNSFIFYPINKILEKIIPAGIPQHLYDLHLLMMFKKYEPVLNSGPKVLTVDDLSFGFVLWLGACGISVAGFVFEILMFQMRKVLRTLIGLWGLLKILRWRLKVVVL